ncbi:hypothetical protein A2282_06860 [candidate division WOR-1 bacterium RIFOXYA12_FULL_36_13]|nr:MAG: hypothetical protein A2282_06860 [candidate division WOR-1 bacterium RIFOXYA12_FULL_36_13]
MVSVVFSSVPTKISYQGILKNSSGSALTGSYNMRFSITSDSAGNSVVWGPESHDSVSVASGIFSVMLGETTALTPSVFSNDTRYIKVEVATPSDSTNYETMSPLTQVLSVGYALRAATAESVVDGSILEASIADGSVSNAKISDGTITNTKAASGNFVKQIVAGNNISISSTEANGTGIITITAEVNSGTLTRVNSGAGLTGGPVTSSGTLEVKYDNSTIDLDGTGSLEVKALGITRAKVANDNFVKQIVAGNNISISSTEADGTGIITITAEVNSGTLTRVNSGAGLTGGPVTSSGTLEVKYDNSTIDLDGTGSLEVKALGITRAKVANDNFVKQIVAGNNISISSTEADGTGIITISAESTGGTVTSVSSGAGLFGGPVTGVGTLEVRYDNSTIDLDVSGSLEVKNSGIATDKIANLAVTAPKIAAGNPIGGYYLRYTGTTLQWATIESVTGSFEVDYQTIGFTGENSLEVINLGISAGKIANSAVTSDKIDNLAVINAKIANGTIDLTSKATYVPVNKTGDTMTGHLTLESGAKYYGDGSTMSNIVTGLSSSGSTAITGRIYLTSGNNITLTQSGQTIEVSSSSPSGTLTGSGTTNYVSKFTGASALGTSTIYDNGTNIGIGTAEPVASFEVAGGILSQGTKGDTPVTGAGTRLMWIPAKGAFRSGTVDGAQWDTIGTNSFAVGNNTTASGNYSTAMGFYSIASGTYSTAMGYGATAGGLASVAIGIGTTTSGNFSTAMGYNTTAIGISSVAAGQFLTAEADNTIVLGKGFDNTSRLNNNKANSLMVGFGGTSPILYASGEAVNGMVGIGTTEPTSKLTVAGTVEMILGSNGTLKFADGTNQTTAYTGNSNAGGWIKSGSTITSEAGINKFGIGGSTTASGSYSISMGFNTTASNSYSTAMGYGTTANGYSSTSMGYTTIAGGHSSTSMGFNTTAGGISSVAAGQWLTTEADNTIVLGKGSSNSSRLNNNKANSLMVGFGGTSPILYVSGEAVSGRVGIGTTEPTAKLTVVSDDGGAAAIGSSDNTATGDYSVAMGADSTAIGRASMAIGMETIAGGRHSMAMGDVVTAMGNASIAAGKYLTTEANNSIVLGRGIETENRLNNNIADSLMVGFGGTSPILFVTGSAESGSVGIGTTEPTAKLTVVTASGGAATIGSSDNTATGDYSVAMGNGTAATGDYSVAMGNGTIASGNTSTAVGQYAWASGAQSFAAGFRASAFGIRAIAMGEYLTTEANNTIVLGKGIDSSNRLNNNIANSLIVGFGGTSPILYVTGSAESGSVGIGTTTPTAKLTVVTGADEGGSATIGSSGNTATGDYSVAIGHSVTASGDNSVAMGVGSTAIGYASRAMGDTARASGNYSTAMGGTTTANNDYSVAVGRWLTTEADNTIVLGKGSSASSCLNNTTANSLIVGFGGTSPILFVSGEATNGHVGIGTTTVASDRKFYVSGSSGGTSAWNNDSDARLKKNVATIDNALHKVKGLRGVTFEWKDPKNHEQGKRMGFIAQEAIKEIPEVVGTGETYSMQYAPITALLVEAIKEQQKIIQKQEERIKALEEKIGNK